VRNNGRTGTDRIKGKSWKVYEGEAAALNLSLKNGNLKKKGRAALKE